MTAVTQAKIEAAVARGTWRNLERIAAGLVQDAEKVAQSATRMNPVLGGGTRLMLAMKHRISDDLELVIRDPQWLGYLTPRKNPLLENVIGSSYMESNDSLKLSFIEGDIHFIVSGSLLDLPTEKAPNCHFELEHPAEILAKRFFYTGWMLRPLDLFDWRTLENRYSPDELHVKEIAKLLRGWFGDKIDSIENALNSFEKPSVGEVLWDEIRAPSSLSYRESMEWAKLRLEQFRIPEPGERTRVRPRAKTGSRSRKPGSTAMSNLSNPPFKQPADHENAAAADELKPAFLEEGDPVEVPPFIMKSNIRELFGWQPGETLEQAIARKKAQG